MTTVTLPRRLLWLSAPGQAGGRAFALTFAATLALGLFLLSALSTGVAMASQGQVLPRVTVGGVAIGSLTRAEADARLRASLPSLSSGHATIVANGDQARVGYDEIGRGYEFEAMLDAAFAIGRSGGPIAEGIARLRSLALDVSVPVVVHPYDDAAMGRVASALAERFTISAVDARVTADGHDWAVHDATIGQAIEADSVRSALAEVAATADPASATIELSPTIDEPTISTAEAEGAADQARAMVADLVLSVGEGDDEATFPVGAAVIRSWITFGPDYGVDYEARVDEDSAAAVVETFRDEIDREPKNAGFSFTGAGVGSVVPGVEGRELDVAASVEALVAGLEDRASGGPVPQVSLLVDVTQPELTTEKAQASLAEMQLVSSWTTYYTPEPGNHFGNNINIPAFDIDGKVLAPGESFSFWGSIGPVTVERGYGYGGVIIGGRSVAGGAIGGGICSTSTTLFNAALRAGLEMGDRLNHYYYIPRYPTGLDATVYEDESWQQDMTFRNDTEHPIVIRGYGGVGFVTFELYGVPTGRNVVLSDPATWNHRAAIETTQVSNDLAPGESKRVEYPHDGFEASVTRWVYDPSGELIHEDTYYSAYRTVNGVTLVGPTPAPEPEPDPPAEEPPPSEPPTP